MTQFAGTAAILLIAYLLGSFPTALVISTRFKGIDIRTTGDGNMGARNVFHEIGRGFGTAVAIIDFAKGALAVFLAFALGLGLGWQLLAGILAIVGHDFPVFTNFKGGFGAATSIGTMAVLFPVPALIGAITYFILFLVTRNFTMSGNIGGAVGGVMLAVSHQWLLLTYAVTVYMLVHVKALIDNSRRIPI